VISEFLDDQLKTCQSEYKEIVEEIIKDFNNLK